MKTAKEWYDSLPNNMCLGYLEDKIAEIQKEAYNQAIDDAAENAEVRLDSTELYAIDKESILKLKKP